MECEVCGKSFTGKPFEVRIEGSLMQTCSSCAKFGKEEKGWSRLPQKRGGPMLEPRPVKRPSWEPQPARKPRPPPKEKAALELVEDYHEAIRRAREMRGLNREDFAKIVNEKASVIVRLESGSLSPDEKLTRKLERLLDIKLLQASEEAPHEVKKA